MPVFLLGGSATLIRGDLGFTEQGLGAAVAIYFLASSLASVHGGRLVERLGSRRAMFLAIGFAAASLLGIATLARDWRSLVGLLVLGGIANAVAQPAANLALARGVSEHRRGLAFGLKQASIPMASALGGFAVPLVGVTAGWRVAYAIAAGVAVVAALMVPEDVARSPAGSRGVNAAPRARGALLFLALGGGLASAAQNSMGGFLVDSSVAVGMAPAAAGLVYGVGSVTGIVSRIVVAGAGDHWAWADLRLVAALLAVGTGGYALLAFSDVQGFLLTGAALGFAAGWGWNGLYIYTIVTTHPHAPAAASGITQAGAFGGSVVGPLLFGATVVRFSYSTAWLAAAASAAAAAVLMVVAWLLIRRHEQAMTSPR